MNNDINICFSSDNNYIPHLAAAVTSLLLNIIDSNRTVNIYILNDGAITDTNIAKVKKLESLRANSTITFTAIDSEIFKTMPLIRGSLFTEATYYRYIIPSLFRDIDRMVYLDCDIIVRGDIAALHNMELGNKAIGAVQDIIGRECQEYLGLDKERYTYCNAGVLVMDINKLREINSQERLIEFTLANSKSLKLLDQDAINSVLRDEITYLGLEWNLLLNREVKKPDYDAEIYNRAKRDPQIVHFIGRKKPWNFGCPNPFTKEYWHYLRHTEFYDDVRIAAFWGLRKIIYRTDYTPTKTRTRIFGLPVCKVVSSENSKKFYILGIKIATKRFKS